MFQHPSLKKHKAGSMRQTSLQDIMQVKAKKTQSSDNNGSLSKSHNKSQSSVHRGTLATPTTSVNGSRPTPRPTPWMAAKSNSFVEFTIDPELSPSSKGQFEPIVISSTENSPSKGPKRTLPWEKREELKKIKRFKPKAGKEQTSKLERVTLNKEQKMVVEKALKGVSFFYTGAAGTGKSVVLREIITALRAIHDESKIAVTASTGLAALHIGGQTLHRFSGTGLGLGTATECFMRLKKNQKKLMDWAKAKVLIIDEISMVDGSFFEKLDYIARMCRHGSSHKPFGGIQVIACGDFFQLPPVPNKNSGTSSTLCFESKAWKEVMKESFVLRQVFRQKGDVELMDMLNNMREGRITPSTISLIRKLARPVHYDDGIEPVELFAKRKQVEMANYRRMAMLPSESRIFESEDRCAKFANDLLDNFMAIKTLELKEGAQVILIKNLDNGLVNGQNGVITGFSTMEDFYGHTSDPFEDKPKSGTSLNGTRLFPVVKFGGLDGEEVTAFITPVEFTAEDGKGNELAYRKQIPLLLSWALSIHKAQGQTLQRVKVDLGHVFEMGQAYVALSRAVTTERLQVLNFDPRRVKAHPKVLEFYESLASVDEPGNNKPIRQLQQDNYFEDDVGDEELLKYFD